MKTVLALQLLCLFLAANVGAGEIRGLSSREIFEKYRFAVVQIYLNREFSGTGFIISSDGVVATANHVVTIKDSGFKDYAPDIKVLLLTPQGADAVYDAVPVIQNESDQAKADRVNFDSTILKLVNLKGSVPHMNLAEWKDIDIGDTVTVIPSFRGKGTMLLFGTVANKAAAQTDMGPKPINVFLFQCPVRNGFSGAPVLAANGTVVGMVNTKVFGIAPELDELRNRLAQTRAQGSVTIMGVDFSASQVQIINSLDMGLISGLGSAIDVDYAKQMAAAVNRK